MAWNKNPRVVELLSWHGSNRGGVHVPFQDTNPLGASPLETTLIERLRTLARSIANGDQQAPRWVFLVGGPGNGKSETVQDFLAHLDQELGLRGVLVDFLRRAFLPHPLVRRRVEVKSTDLESAPGSFAQRVGRLIVLQDATATDEPLGDAAQQLAEDIADLLTTPEDPPPVFVACTNRGLLARALKEASRDWGDQVTNLLAQLIRASSLGLDALARDQDRPPCWPIDSDPRVACWPLDLESLILPRGTSPSPVEQIFLAAVDETKWETVGRCADCDATPLCPFRQNAAWLRSQVTRRNLLIILRHGELATGQRWNFRDTFSLVAELVVGQWEDFGGTEHPCGWVHQCCQQLNGTSIGPSGIVPSYQMLHRLYPHALFAQSWLRESAEEYAKVASENDQSLSKSVLDLLSIAEAGPSKPIREKLQEDYGSLDPATFTPREPNHALRLIEDDFSQSIELGNRATRNPSLTEIENTFLHLLEDAEAEWDWDLLGRSASQASRVVALLRRQASILVKRSVGVRLGHHAREDYLRDYELSLHDLGRLNLVREALQSLFGAGRFQFDLVESFGQPQGELEQLVTLVSDTPGIRPFPAPQGSARVPGHDMPFFKISDIDYPMPVTFDFYLALRLRREGCASSSLPASVRAAVDRVRHRSAGELSKKKSKFVDGSARVIIGGTRSIGLTDETSEPSWSRA